MSAINAFSRIHWVYHIFLHKLPAFILDPLIEIFGHKPFLRNAVTRSVILVNFGFFNLLNIFKLIFNDLNTLQGNVTRRNVTRHNFTSY